MSVTADLKRLSSAEEFFDYLGVAYEPPVVNVARLHILKRLAGLLSANAAELEKQSDDEVRERFKSFLEQAYEELTQEGPMQQRLFKVHKDAVAEEKRPQPAFVPLSAIAPGAADSSGGRD